MFWCRGRSKLPQIIERWLYENIWIHYWWQWQVEMSHKLMSVLVPRPENDPVSHYWKHSKSFNWRNIWTWLWATLTMLYFLLQRSPQCHSPKCLVVVREAEPWQLNPATKSVSLSTSLPICRCRIPAILLPVIVLCKVVLCQIRFTSYNFVLSFKACVVHHITLLSDSTALLNLFCNLLTSTKIFIAGSCGEMNNEGDYLSQDNQRHG